MKKHALACTKRDIVGRKVKKLRASGQIPATIYGKKVESVSISVDTDAFTRVYKEAGETGLVELSVNGSMRSVLVHHVQKDPVSDAVLHVEFHQVDLKEKVHANVPLVTIGESPAVSEKRGVLLTILDEIEVEALPMELPEKIEVDVSGLAEVNAEVKVENLAVPAGVVVLTEATLTVVKIGSLVSKEAEAEAAVDAAKAAEAAAVTAGAEGEATPPEGEAAAQKAPVEKEEKKKE